MKKKIKKYSCGTFTEFGKLRTIALVGYVYENLTFNNVILVFQTISMLVFVNTARSVNCRENFEDNFGVCDFNFIVY